MKHTLDSRRLTLLRQERGLSTREVALDSGIDIAVLRRLEATGDPSLSTISLAQFLRLADRLNVPAETLLATETPASEPTEPDDPELLGALLHELSTHTQTLIVADALGWDIPRVHAAADRLDNLLEPAGTSVYRDSGRISIRPRTDRHQPATVKVKQDPRLPYSQRVLTPARTRMTYRAMHGALSEHAFGEADRRDFALLKRVGYLTETDNGITLTNDVIRSLYPEQHSADHERPA